MRLKVPPFEAIKRIDNLIKAGMNLRIHCEDVCQSMNEEEFRVKFNKLYVSWYQNTLNELGAICLDATPIFKLTYPSKSFHAGKKFLSPEAVKFCSTMQDKLFALEQFYDQLIPIVRSPLMYSSEMAVISYYGMHCELKQGSNEADLCSYLFQYAINNAREMEDAYAYMTGESINESEKWHKKWKTTVTQAIKGVNKKTNQYFNFPIIKTKKTIIYINIPSEIIGRMN